jgi:3-hydroxy-9,10-secoandrosta-1,3,5(10)-triene-9,17-dione monooxygenase
MPGASMQSVPVGTLPQQVRRDFSSVGYDEALRRAREIVPLLRERAAKSEVARMLTRDNEQLLHESGLFRFHQPRVFGGMELDFVAVVDIPAELARGCPSTAWSVGNVACHHWILGYYDPETQREVWDSNPDALIASSIALAAGRARKADGGGFIVNGRWPFSSVVDNSDWNMLAVTVLDDDGKTPVDWRLCLVPNSDYEIVDTWYAMGMAGTGSNAAAGVSIPVRRSIPDRSFAFRSWPPPATRSPQRHSAPPRAPTTISSRPWPNGRAPIPARGWPTSRRCRSRSRGRAA